MVIRYLLLIISIGPTSMYSTQVSTVKVISYMEQRRSSSLSSSVKASFLGFTGDSDKFSGPESSSSSLLVSISLSGDFSGAMPRISEARAVVAGSKKRVDGHSL